MYLPILVTHLLLFFLKGYAFLGNPCNWVPYDLNVPGRFVAMRSIAYYHS